jgi:hypothetical protein
MGKPAVAITLTAAERAEREGLASRRRTAQGVARRARIVLAAADRMENQAIAEFWASIRTPSANGVGASLSGG